MESKTLDWLMSLNEPQDPKSLQDFQAWASADYRPDSKPELAARKCWLSLTRDADSE